MFINKTWKFLAILVAVLLGLILMLPVIINNIDINQFRPFVEARVLALTGRQLKIDGDLQLNLSLHPSLKVKEVSFANASWSKQKAMVMVDVAELKIALMPLLKRQVVVENLVLKGVVLVIEKNGSGLVNWSLDDSGATEDGSGEESDAVFYELPFTPVLKQAQFDDVAVEYSDVSTKLKTKVNIEKLRLSSHEVNEPYVFNVNGAVNGHPFDIIGETVFHNNAKESGDKPLLIKMDANAVGVALSLNGKVNQPIIEGGIDVDLSLEVKDVNNTFTALTGQSLSLYSIRTDQVIPFQLSTNISNNKNVYDLSTIKVRLAGSDLKGSMSLINVSERQQIKVYLSSEVIYLDRLLAEEDVDVDVGESDKVFDKKLPLIIPDVSLDFDWLNEVDGELVYSAKKVHVDKLLVEDVSFNAQLDDGLLQVKQLDFDMGAASVHSHFSIDGERKVPLINVAAVIKKVDLSAWAKYASFPSVRRGKLNADINIEGRGANIKSLLFSLSGQSKLHVSQLRMKQDVSNKARDIYIDELTLIFAEMSEPVAFTLSGMLDREEVLVSGELATVSSILHNRSTRLISKTKLLGAEFSIDASSTQPMAFNLVQADVSVTLSEPNKSFRRLEQLFPNISIDGEIPPLPVSVSAHLDISPVGVDAKGLDIAVGKNDLRGDVLIDTSQKNLFIKANVYSDLVNLDTLHPLFKGEQIEQGAAPNKDKLFSTEPLPSFNWLGYLNADIHYQLKKLTKNNQIINNVSLDLTLNKGVLNVAPLMMDFAKGTINTNLRLGEDDDLNFQTSIIVNNLDYTRLMALVGTKEYAKGNFDADIHLQGVGGSVSELMAGLSGQVRLTSEGGSLNMDAMQLLSKDLVSLIPFTDRGDRQKIRCAVMQFDIDDGIAKSHALVLDTGIVSALGAGKVNLATESLSLYVSPRTKRTSVLKLALVPLNIRGSFLSPTITPDAAGTTVSTTNKAVHIGLAVATGGITLLTEDLTNKLWEQFIDDTDYCALALAGEKVVPALARLKDDGDELDQSEKDEDYIEELDDDDGGI
jgi:uncharacterized protein involved in outer membrane biogenesis